MSQSATYRPPLLRRSSAAGVNNTPGRCPFLGTPNDPGTSLAFPSEANHCFRSRFPIPISSIHQENYCLSSQYESCPVYRQYAAQDERAEVAPVAAVAMAGAAMAAPEPRWTNDAGGSAIAPTAAAAASMALGAGRGPAATYEEPIHPDFQADPGPAASPLPARRALDVDPRSVLLGLVLLAMVALGGWAVLTFLGGRDGRTPAGQGAIVSLPTAAATVDRTVGETASAVVVGQGAAATATALALAAAATPTAEQIAAATDAAEGVAATATALFAGAVATAECHAPDWWVPYVTQEGDTVEALAAARGILPEELIVANCLAAPELTPGIELRLPPVGVIVLLPGPTATPLPPTPTAAVIFPTRRPPLIFPTATFPVIVVPTAAPLEPEPGEPTPARPRPTAAPTQPANATATPPIFPTLTPPLFPATATPPIFGTAQPTKTPPGGGGEVTPTVTPTVGPSRTPPIP